MGEKEVSLAVCVLITWVVIIIFSLIPKKLSELDLVILYFSNVIFEVSIFTILHVNLRMLIVKKTVEHSIADLMLNLIMEPLIFIMTANILLYSWKSLKWVISAVIILCFPLIGLFLHWLGILETRHWNVGYSFFLAVGYAVFSSMIAWVLTRLDRKEVKKA